jgi:tRNA pseudouridine55 synthase
LYELARRGVAVEASPAEVEIHRFELEPTDRPELYDFTVDVSRGTYVRALVRDLGRTLGCGGVMSALVRTRIGPMELDHARPWPTAPPDRAWVLEALVPPARMPLTPPPLRLDAPDAARRFALGATVTLGADDRVRTGLVRVQTADGELLGIGEASRGTLRPRVVLPPPDDGASSLDPTA